MNMTTDKRRFSELISIARTTSLMLLVTWVGHLGAQLPALSFSTSLSILPGLFALFIVVVFGYTLAILIPTRLPDIFWVSVVAAIAGIPGLPGAALYIDSVSKLSFVAMITPVLAFVALSLTSREIRLFRQTGLQMIILSTLIFTGTFIGSAVIAHYVLIIT